MKTLVGTKTRQDKYLVLLLLMALLSLKSKAQKEGTPNALLMTAGPSFPAGSFARKNMQDGEAGFAMTGPGFAIAFTHTVHRLGWTVALHAQRNAVDAPALEQDLARGNNYPVLYLSGTTERMRVNFPTQKYQNWNAGKASWFQAGLQAGGYARLINAGSFLFDATARIGFHYVRSPELTAKSNSDTSQASFEQKRGKGFGLSSSLGAGLQYRLSNAVWLVTRLDYTLTNRIRFRDIAATFTAVQLRNPVPSWESATVTGDAFQKFSYAQLQLGLSFTL